MSARIVVKYDNFKRIAARFEDEVSRIVQSTAQAVSMNAKSLMRGVKHGRVYMRGKRRHIASKPGEAPAVDTGKLKGSIMVRMVTKHKAIVTPTAEYAYSLEFGTRRIAPRPFMRPSAEKAASVYFERMRRLEEKL